MKSPLLRADDLDAGLGNDVRAPVRRRRQEPHAANVLVVTLDGMRWQEVFGGLASDLLTKENGGVTDPEKRSSSSLAVRRRKSVARS